MQDTDWIKNDADALAFMADLRGDEWALPESHDVKVGVAVLETWQALLSNERGRLSVRCVQRKGRPPIHLVGPHAPIDAVPERVREILGIDGRAFDPTLSTLDPEKLSRAVMARCCDRSERAYRVMWVSKSQFWVTFELMHCPTTVMPGLLVGVGDDTPSVFLPYPFMVGTARSELMWCSLADIVGSLPAPDGATAPVPFMAPLGEERACA